MGARVSEETARAWARRLRLKWGEALFFAGTREGAKSQLAHAAQLDLTPSEKSELAGMHS